MDQHSTPPDWPLPDERELEKLYTGDEAAASAALVELRQRHVDELRAQAHHQCGGSTQLAEEALQRLDVRLWAKRTQYIPCKGFWIAWAKTLLRNIIADLFREGGQAPSAPPPTFTDPNPSPSDPMDCFPGRAPPPDWKTRLQELRLAMQDCLQRLPPEQREALILRDVEELSYQEIGEKTEGSWQTAATRVRLAREKMKACLKRKGFDGGEV